MMSHATSQVATITRSTTDRSQTQSARAGSTVHACKGHGSTGKPRHTFAVALFKALSAFVV